MPQPASSLEEARHESRTRIMESALELFARYGYEGTSVRRIAQEAGVSPGLLYNYFQGKEGLLRAIFQRSMNDVQGSFEEAARARNPGERIRGLVLGSLRVVRANLPFWRLTYQLRMQPGVLEGLGARVDAWSGGMQRQLETLLEEAGSPEPGMEARALFAAIDGAAQHLALDPEGYPAQEVANALVRRFVPGSAGGSDGSLRPAGGGGPGRGPWGPKV